MDLILSIIKNFKLLIFLSLIACSSNKTIENTAKTNDASIGELEETRELSIPGPTGLLDGSVFKDVTVEYGLTGLKATNFYAVDFNQDGHTDIAILPSFYSTPEFLLFDSKKNKFIKIDYNPFDENVRASFMSFYDLDKDGVRDVIIGTFNQKTELSKSPLKVFKGYLDPSGKFYFSSAIPKTSNDRLAKNIEPISSVSLIDFDLDGNLDLFQANWFSNKQNARRPLPDRFFIGSKLSFTENSAYLDQERTFNKSLASFINAKATFSSSTCDLDQNGFPDILTTSTAGQHNKIWLNVYNRSIDGRYFREYGKETKYASDIVGFLEPLGGGSSFYSVCADYNNDGIMDVAVGELFHSYDSESRDKSSILTGASKGFPPKFLRTEYDRNIEENVWSQADRRGLWVDYNVDGLEDLIVENSGFPPHTRLIMFEQENNHSFLDVSESIGINILNPTGTTLIDVDQNGLWDVLVGQTNIRDSRILPRVYLFKNVSNRIFKNRSIKILLKSQKSNAQALGAMVKLKTSEWTARKWNHYSFGSSPSQNEEGLLFGLGKTAKPEYIDVTWPIIVNKKSRRPLTRRYKFNNLDFKNHLNIVLNEDGSYQVLD